MDLSSFSEAESEDWAGVDSGTQPTNISVQVLKTNQLAALESLASLLLREVESLKRNEERAVRRRSNDKKFSLYRQVQEFEVAMIRSALIRAGGVQKKAAEFLGLKVSTLNVKIKRYKIDFKVPVNNS